MFNSLLVHEKVNHFQCTNYSSKNANSKYVLIAKVQITIYTVIWKKNYWDILVTSIRSKYVGTSMLINIIFKHNNIYQVENNWL